jgi:hypothetical protein
MIYTVNNTQEVWDVLNSSSAPEHNVQFEGVFRMNIEVSTKDEQKFEELMATVDSNLKKG